MLLFFSLVLEISSRNSSLFDKNYRFPCLFFIIFSKTITVIAFLQCLFFVITKFIGSIIQFFLNNKVSSFFIFEFSRLRMFYIFPNYPYFVTYFECFRVNLGIKVFFLFLLRLSLFFCIILQFWWLVDKLECSMQY